MNMNDALLGSLIFSKSGELEFTKASILDKTQMANNTIVLTTDYTDYPFLLFSFMDTDSNTPVEALVPTAILTETFSYSEMFCICNRTGKRYIRYSKSSNTRFTVYDGSYMSLVDVFGVEVNRPFTTDIIYARGDAGESSVSITHDNILDNDLIFFSGCWNADVDFSNDFIYIVPNINKITTNYSCIGTVTRRYYGVGTVTVTNTTISSAIHYMVLGFKFT